MSRVRAHGAHACPVVHVPVRALHTAPLVTLTWIAGACVRGTSSSAKEIVAPQHTYPVPPLSRERIVVPGTAVPLLSSARSTNSVGARPASVAGTYESRETCAHAVRVSTCACPCERMHVCMCAHAHTRARACMHTCSSQVVPLRIVHGLAASALMGGVATIHSHPSQRARIAVTLPSDISTYLCTGTSTDARERLHARTCTHTRTRTTRTRAGTLADASERAHRFESPTPLDCSV